MENSHDFAEILAVPDLDEHSEEYKAASSVLTSWYRLLDKTFGKADRQEFIDAWRPKWPNTLLGGFEMMLHKVTLSWASRSQHSPLREIKPDPSD